MKKIFRGKRKDNGEWVEGYIYEHQPPLQGIVPKDYVPEKSKWYICKTAFADWNMPRQIEYTEVVPETVGQYINHNDCKDNLLFEGDIMKYTDSNWGYGGDYDKEHDEYCYEVIPPLEDIMSQLGSFDINHLLLSDLEKVGNIYDNPELLKSNKRYKNMVDYN